MKKIISFLLLTGFISCSKKDIVETKPADSYQIRIAALENNGSQSFTAISRVKGGKVAVEFETTEVSDVKEYHVEISVDGTNFKKVKTITADLANPNRIYRDTVILE